MQNKFKNIKGIYLVILALLSFGLTCFYQIWLYNNGQPYNVWYNFSGILIASACLFILMSRLKIKLTKYLSNIFSYISRVSLAIFFLHILVIKTLTKYISFNIINKPISIFILTFVVFLISLLIIFVISRSKLVKEKVLLIK
jgi:surface polysaccharide O-acyltransferase-like enzyme